MSEQALEAGETGPVEDGTYWLDVIGMSSAVGSFVDAGDEYGIIRAENFLDICAPKALPILRKIRTMSETEPDNPDLPKYRQAARQMIISKLIADAPDMTVAAKPIV